MLAKTRIGIYSGMFDPPLQYHISAAISLTESFKLDRVLVIPSDSGGCQAGYADRLNMVTAACGDEKSLIPFSASQLQGKSVESAEAVQKLKAFFPDAVVVPASPEQTMDANRHAANILTPQAGSDEIVLPVLEYIEAKGLYGRPARVPESGPWMDKLASSLKPHRFAHSLSVADTARRMAARFGEDALKAEIAGLLHDCAKNLPLADMQMIARRNNLTDDSVFLENSALLHSVVGAWVAEHEYGMTDPDILDAIRYHNTGHADMSRLAMCVCLSDSIEPLRHTYPLLENVRKMSEQSLEKALLLSLEGTAGFVRKKGGKLHPRTLETIAWLKKLPAVRD